MSYMRVKEYSLCIDSIRCDEALMNITVSSFPSLKKSARKKVVREFEGRVKKPMQATGKPLNSKEFYNYLIGKLKVGR